MFILIGSLVVLTVAIAFCVKAKSTKAKSLSDVKDPNYASLKGPIEAQPMRPTEPYRVRTNDEAGYQRIGYCRLHSTRTCEDPLPLPRISTRLTVENTDDENDNNGYQRITFNSHKDYETIPNILIESISCSDDDSVFLPTIAPTLALESDQHQYSVVNRPPKLPIRSFSIPNPEPYYDPVYEKVEKNYAKIEISPYAAIKNKSTSDYAIISSLY